MFDDGEIDPRDKEALADLLKRCCLSTKVFCKTFFPNRFRAPFSALHDQIFAVLDDDRIKKALILAPRGFGKTSITQLGFTSKRILFGESRFIVPISCSSMQAVTQTEALKRELMSNTTIARLFGGNMKGDWFGKDQWVTSSNVCVMPRGSGQQVRGLLYGDYRPDLIVIDDLEDSEAVRSEERRAKMKEYLYADVLNSVDEKDDNWRVVMIGTLLHEDAITANILNEYEQALKEGRKPDWHVVHLSICDSQYRSNWPDAFPDEKVRGMVEEYRRRGLLDVFAREYMNLPVSGESNFKREYFKYFEEGEITKEKGIVNLVLVDPAKTTNESSCDTALVVVGVDVENHRLFIREVINGKLHPDEQYEMAFQLIRRWRARALGWEVTGLNEFITYPLKNAMREKNITVPLVELKARGKKEDRIAALLPFYRQGLVYHNKTTCLDLEMQLLSYPRSRRWDVMDALAYVVELLESGECYFLEAWSETAEGIEAEYKELEELDAEDRDEKPVNYMLV
jgi:hypothetical protein